MAMAMARTRSSSQKSNHAYIKQLTKIYP